MLTKIIIFVENQKTYTSGYNESYQLEYFLVDDNGFTNHGVYLAKINNIQSKNNLAWVNYESDKVGVINLPKSHNLQSGSAIICQMNSEAYLDKMPKFNTEIKLAGKYVVLLTTLGHHYANGLSNHDNLGLISGKYKHLGIIFRSSINSVTDLAYVEEEINLLSQKLNLLSNQNKFGMVLEGVPSYIELLHKYSENTHVITNNEKVFNSLEPQVNLWGIEELSIDNGIKDPNVKLNNSSILSNGIKLNIHQLSGINLIDIDSSSSNLSFYQVNYLAIDDIVKQVKLNDLKGIILIDFIKNMNIKEQANLFHKLKVLLKDDWRRNKVLGFTKSGIFEIIRSK